MLVAPPKGGALLNENVLAGFGAAPAPDVAVAGLNENLAGSVVGATGAADGVAGAAVEGAVVGANKFFGAADALAPPEGLNENPDVGAVPLVLAGVTVIVGIALAVDAAASFSFLSFSAFSRCSFSAFSRSRRSRSCFSCSSFARRASSSFFALAARTRIIAFASSSCFSHFEYVR